MKLASTNTASLVLFLWLFNILSVYGLTIVKSSTTSTSVIVLLDTAVTGTEAINFCSDNYATFSGSYTYTRKSDPIGWGCNNEYFWIGESSYCPSRCWWCDDGGNIFYCNYQCDYYKKGDGSGDSTCADYKNTCVICKKP
eukprot:144941_1